MKREQRLFWGTIIVALTIGTIIKQDLLLPLCVVTGYVLRLETQRF